MRSKLAICQEWFWSKKEENNNNGGSSNDYTDVADIWLKINSYKKNMVSLYEKAIEELSKDLLKFSPSSNELAKEDHDSITQSLKDIVKSTTYHATNSSSSINACRRAFEQQLKTIGLDLKKIDTNNNYAHNTYLYWYPGEDGVYSFYDKEIIPDKFVFVLTTTYDGYSRITAAFKNMGNSKLSNVLSDLLKEIESCVEKGYNIKTPTLDKLYNTYVDSQMAHKYWDDKCELVSVPYYGFIRQGMYLRDPKFTKDKLKEEVKAVANKYNVEI